MYFFPRSVQWHLFWRTSSYIFVIFSPLLKRWTFRLRFWNLYEYNSRHFAFLERLKGIKNILLGKIRSKVVFINGTIHTRTNKNIYKCIIIYRSSYCIRYVALKKKARARNRAWVSRSSFVKTFLRRARSKKIPILLVVEKAREKKLGNYDAS